MTFQVNQRWLKIAWHLLIPNAYKTI
jgi:hypothetical protein